MYKLIIVDDEKEVRQGMIQKIPFNDLGYECVGEAENGLDALELIEKANPDLGIIDIKMPYMDGIELAERIHSKYPAMRLIILSGFDDFEFARQAIKYNVLEYILKPVSLADIVELLQKTKIQLDEIKEAKQDMKRLKDHYMESMPLLRERLLNATMREKQNIISIKDKLKRYHCDLGLPNYRVAIVHPDNIWDLDETEELYAFSIHETVKEVVEKKAIVTFQNPDGESIVVLNHSSEYNQQQLLEEIRQSIEKLNDLTVTIGVGEEVLTLDTLKNSYAGAKQALQYAVVEGRNNVLYIEDLEPERLDRIIFDAELDQTLNNLIRSHNIEALKKELSDIYDEITSRHFKIEDIRVFVTEWLTSLLRLSRSYHISVPWFEKNRDIYKAIEKIRDFNEIKSLISETSILLSEAIHAARSNSMKVLIEDVVNYMDVHYDNMEISLDFMAHRFHLSSEYLSRQFKKEKGITFSNYLTKIRLEKAKALIEDTNMKNFQIAEQVGYNEANYFSYAYKKYFGISPSAYRKSLKV